MLWVNAAFTQVYVSCVFLVLYLVFSCCICVFLGNLKYFILLPVSVIVQKL